MKKYIFALLAMTTVLVNSVNAGVVIISKEKPVEAFSFQGMYVGSFGGINFASIKDVNRVKIQGVKTGFVGGAFLGYKVDNLRIEGEISYRINTVKTDSILKNDGSRTTHNMMLNVYHDFDIGTEYMPYVGAGAGYANNKTITDMKNGGVYTHTNKFAYQLIGGIHYRAADKVHVGAEYKYLSSEKGAQNHTTSISIKRYF